MELDKNTIVKFIRDHIGDHDKADTAAKELPDKVDTDKDSGLLARFGVDDPKQILGKLGDLKGGLGGLLGGDKK